MSLYTVTIEPCDSSGAPAGSAQAVVRVDTGAPKPRIVEMTLQSAAPSGLTSATLPTIDLNGVVEALQSGIAPARSAKPAAASTARTRSVALAAAKPASKASPARNRTKVAAKGPARRSSDRAYRRMPDAKELGAAYKRIGTVTGVAKHYDVPRHTAQGWMKRLRGLDATVKASAPKKQRS